MNKPELLLPAGNIQKLEYAIKYGADAVYLGVVDFSLRAMKKGDIITFDNLKDAISLAHKLGAKAYLTLNIFAFNKDIKHLEESLEIIKDSNPDAILVSDFGFIRLLKKYMPNTPLHISTQTNTLNYECVKFWQDLGASRVVLARELSIAEMAEIKQKVPDMELECFVHGAQCVSFSGRCLLSDYFTDGERISNQGNCCQPCRWSYKLVEETRPGEYYEIKQGIHGTHILSPKDLCLIRHLRELMEAGIDSFKIEGRTKSLYYVSDVAKTYRKAIDALMENPEASMTKYLEELKKVGNRGYTTGFALGENPPESYSYNLSKSMTNSDFLFEILDKNKINGEDLYLIKIKNRIYPDDEIEIITPDERFKTRIAGVYDLKGFEMVVGNTNAELYVKLGTEPRDYKYALARTSGSKK